VVVKSITLAILEEDELSSLPEVQTRARSLRVMRGFGNGSGSDGREKAGWSGSAGDSSPVLYVHIVLA
jgi:hypothetical protein